VFHYPVAAGWDVSEEEVVFSDTFTTVSGRNTLYLDTYNTQVALRQVISGLTIASGTSVTLISSSGIKTLGAITGGTLYTNGTYTGVSLTGGSGVNATANITVSGGAVTVVTIVNVGAGYVIGNVLSATAASIGGTGSGFSVPVSAIYAQIITMSAAAIGSGTQVLTFSTPANLISIWQHELGVNRVEGQNQNAIESYFETNDLGLVSGGPSQPSPVGDNFWLHLERVEPDFLQEGVMSLFVTGRPFAQSEDLTTGPYLFDPNTGKIDLREQRRELRLRFVSNVVNGDYQVGKVILNANIGDVRP
jgi:hypothetical protein